MNDVFKGFAEFEISNTRKLIADWERLKSEKRKKWEDYTESRPDQKHDAHVRHFCAVQAWWGLPDQEWEFLENVISDLIFAWRHFREGSADKNEQLVCHEIMLYLLESKSLKRSKTPTNGRNLRVQMVIECDGLSATKASAVIAKFDGANADTVRREFQKWNSQTDEEKAMDEKRYSQESQAKFHQIIDWE